MTYRLVPYDQADIPTGGAATIEVSPAKVVALLPPDLSIWNKLAEPRAREVLPRLPEGWIWLLLPPGTVLLKLEEEAA